MGVTYFGKPIEKLKKAELIRALEEAVRQIEMSEIRFNHYRQFMKDLTTARG